jgi:hypothetical protein
VVVQAHSSATAPAAAVTTIAAISTTSATAAEPATTSATASSAATTRTALLRDVDTHRATFEIRAVELRDRFLCRLGRSHLDEREATRPAGLVVEHHADVLDLTDRGKPRRDELLRRIKR